MENGLEIAVKSKEFIPDDERVKFSNDISRAIYHNLKTAIDYDLFITIIKRLSDNLRNTASLSTSFSVSEIIKKKAENKNEMSLDKKIEPAGAMFQIYAKSTIRVSTVALAFIDEKKYTASGIPLFSKVEYNNGIIFAELNPYMREYFLSKIFTQFAEIDYLKLNSKHAKRLFILLKSYQSINNIVSISVDLLRKHLNLSDRTYKTFSHIERMLNQAKEQIEHKTSLRFSFAGRLGNKGRKFETIDFAISYQPELFKEVATGKMTKFQVPKKSVN